MIARLYLFIRAFVRRRILHIDDRSQLDIAVSNGLRIGKDWSCDGGMYNRSWSLLADINRR